MRAGANSTMKIAANSEKTSPTTTETAVVRIVP
jgi:hypothetical protein